MPRHAKQDAWEQSHPNKVKEYQRRYDQAHLAERRKAQREWHRAHGNTYGNRAQYLRVMQQTGGIGYSSSTGYQSRPKAGRPGPGRKPRSGANTKGAWTGNPNETM
jgi:hypothetical protein